MDGFGIGLYIDPASGQVFIAEGLGVALAVVAWIGALIGGLVTAWLVMP